jgi:hypothetical protein
MTISAAARAGAARPSRWSSDQATTKCVALTKIATNAKMITGRKMMIGQRVVKLGMSYSPQNRWKPDDHKAATIILATLWHNIRLMALLCHKGA